MKGIIFSSLLFLTTTIQAGFQDEFESAWSVDGSSYTAASGTDTQGNLYVVGNQFGSLGFFGGTDVYIGKYAPDGTALWSRAYGTPAEDRASSITIDTAGNIYVSGKTNGAFDGNVSSGEYDIFVSKFDEDGAELWTRQFGSAVDDLSRSVATDSSGSIYLTGVLSPTGSSYEGDDAFISKISADGTVQWIQRFGTTEGDGGHSISIDSNNNIYVAGRTLGAFDGYSNQGSFDIFVSKFTTDGVRLWDRQYGGPESDHANSITTDASGNFYLAGELFVAKYDAEGNEIWSDESPADAIDLDNQGNIYIGYTWSESCDPREDEVCSDFRSISHFSIRKYTTDGRSVWDQQFVTSPMVEAGSVTIDSGNIYFTANVSYSGYSYSTEIGRLEPVSSFTTSGDRFNPNISLEHSGNSLTGRAGDNEDLNLNGILDNSEDLNGNAIIDFRSEDVNADGVLDASEDSNGDGILDIDSGIADVELEAGAVNLALTVDPFVAGTLQTDFSVSLIDPTSDGSGTLIVSDVAGNTVSREITLTGTPVSFNECSSARDYFAHADDGPVEIHRWAHSPNDPGADTPEHVMWISGNDNPDLFDEQPWVSYPSWSLYFQAKPGVYGTATITYGVVDYATGGQDYLCGEERFQITILAPGEEPPAPDEDESGLGDTEASEQEFVPMEEEIGPQSGEPIAVRGDSNEAQPDQDSANTSGVGGIGFFTLLLLGGIMRLRKSG